MRFETDLPWGAFRLVYGLDPRKGWFGELLEEDKVIASCDHLSPTHDDAMRGLLIWIGHASEIYDETELDACLAALTRESADDLWPHFGFIIEVAGNLRAAAAET